MRAAEGHGVPEGSVAVGHRIRLPRGAEPPFTVFINGVEQGEGTDYRVSGGEIVFSRPILKEKKLTGVRWLSMLAGIAGTYRKHETVDLQFTRGGRVELASDLPIHADQASPPDVGRQAEHGGRSH